MLSSRTRTRFTTAGALIGALGAALTVGVAGELSPAAHVAVLTAGAVVVAAGLARRAGAGNAPADRRGLPWLLALGLVLAWEALALAEGGVPTVSDLLDPVLAPAAVRAAATLAWLATGAWLVSGRRAPLGAAMRTTPGRVGVLLAWLWVGLHFLAR